MMGVIGTALPGPALAVAVLLCPAIVFAFQEKAPSRPIARIMALTGAAAAIGTLRDVWEGGGTLTAALEILADPARPLLAWSACAAGWLLCETSQIATSFALARQAKRRIQMLRREQEALMEEWRLDDAKPG